MKPTTTTNQQEKPLKIDILRETGLVLLTKCDNTIELTADDIEEIIQFYKDNQNKIARTDEFNN